MKTTLICSVLVTTVLLLVGCGGAATEPPAEPEVVAVADAVGPEGLVVAAEGTEFAPPVEPEVLPEGVWYCDMGTVHYARVVEGDGRCPLCGMYLKQYGAGEPADESADPHEGHAHEG